MTAPRRRNNTAQAGSVWRRKMARIIRRDAGICHLCDKPGADTADHLVPVSQGGSNADWNLKAAHRHCNVVRGDRPIQWARDRLAQEQARTVDDTPGSWSW